jgi:hypothetical protein
MRNIKKLSINFGTIIIFGMVITAATNVYVTALAQLNTTTNQGLVNTTTNQGLVNTTTNQGLVNTTTNQSSSSVNNTNISNSSKDEASASIKGAIIETGEFLGNVTQKVAKSKSAGSLLNETSEILGDAYVQTKKFFSPN